MKPITIVGAILIAAGALALIFGGITYTQKEEVVDIGPIEATAEQRERIPISPVLSGIAIVAGVACVVAGVRKR
ncbi:MAG: DUF3185 domain-containing protein [Gemmatimonadaceae bacterium]